MKILFRKKKRSSRCRGGGYIKRLPPGTFKVQRRGGKGLIGSEVADEDFLSHFFSANTHDNVLFFTDRGRVFQTKVYEIPQATRTSKGKAIQNFLELPSNENVSAIVSYSAKGAKAEGKSGKKYLMMVTKQGVIKKTPLEDFENIRRTGIIAISSKRAISSSGRGLRAARNRWCSPRGRANPSALTRSRCVRWAARRRASARSN